MWAGHVLRNPRPRGSDFGRLYKMGSDDTLGKVKDPLVAVVTWIKTRSAREKLIMGCLAGFLGLLILWKTISVRSSLFSRWT